MKKFAMIAMMCFCLCGCNQDKGVNAPNPIDTTVETGEEAIQEKSIEVEQEPTEVTVEEVKADELEETITEEKIRELVDENIYCMTQIFSLGSLPTVGEPLDGEWLYQVDESYFEDYKAFETYIHSVYGEDTAHMLLNDYPYEGVQKYVEYEGKLCLNRMYDGAKGYNVDWSSYGVEIGTCEEGRCHFTLKASKTEPGDQSVAEAYIVESEAVYEEGRWRLSQMIY